MFNQWQAWITTISLFFCLSFYLSGLSYAFNTHPTHCYITTQGASKMGLNLETIKLLCAAVNSVDRDDGTYEGTRNYRYYHHFDRIPGLDNKKAFTAGVKHIRKMAKETAQALLKRKLAPALTFMGRGLHGIQDFASHSNIIDLNLSDQERVIKILFDDASFKEIPSRLLLTGFDQKAKIPGIPPGDKYAHDLLSKDAPYKNPESMKRLGLGLTKFLQAQDFAIGLTILFINMVYQKIGAQHYAEIELLNSASIGAVFPAIPEGMYNKHDSPKNWRKNFIGPDHERTKILNNSKLK